MKRSRSESAVSSEDLRYILEPRVGRIVSASAEGILVDYPGNSDGPRRARCIATVAERLGNHPPGRELPVLLVFENGDPGLPIVIGALSSETPLLDAVLEAPQPTGPVEARVDGTRVVIEARDEIELRCGKASITLWRNGRIELRGVNVKAEAREVNRIRGGKVEIN